MLILCCVNNKCVDQTNAWLNSCQLYSLKNERLGTVAGHSILVIKVPGILIAVTSAFACTEWRLKRKNNIQEIIAYSCELSVVTT